MLTNAAICHVRVALLAYAALAVRRTEPVAFVCTQELQLLRGICRHGVLHAANKD